METTVDRLQEIEQRIRMLTGPEYQKLREWLDVYDEETWDATMEAAVAAGKWDALADEALLERAQGKTTPL